MEILGPFPKAIGEYKYLYVAIKKFTKWMIVMVVIKIDKHSTVKILEGIVSLFGILYRVITDNGSQFTYSLFSVHCKDMIIMLFCVSPHHP